MLVAKEGSVYLTTVINGKRQSLQRIGRYENQHEAIAAVNKLYPTLANLMGWTGHETRGYEKLSSSVQSLGQRFGVRIPSLVQDLPDGITAGNLFVALNAVSESMQAQQVMNLYGRDLVVSQLQRMGIKIDRK